MVNLEEQHQKIRLKAHAIHWGLLPLALSVPLLWIYFALDLCQEGEPPGMLRFCRWFGWTPLMPAVLGALVCGWIAWDLAILGHGLRRQAHPSSYGGPRPHHIRHGYRAIDQRHKRHVHFAVAQTLLVGAGLVAWLLWQWCRTTH